MSFINKFVIKGLVISCMLLQGLLSTCLAQTTTTTEEKAVEIVRLLKDKKDTEDTARIQKIQEDMNGITAAKRNARDAFEIFGWLVLVGIILMAAWYTLNDIWDKYFKRKPLLNKDSPHRDDAQRMLDDAYSKVRNSMSSPSEKKISL